MHPCQYKVAARIRKGPTKGQRTIAQFADQRDAINFGFEKSQSRFRTSSNVDVLIYDIRGRVVYRLRQGVIQ